MCMVHSCTVIDDEEQARKCLNFSATDIEAPFPVVLESSISNKFVCLNSRPFYSFTCIAKAVDTIWYFNDTTVTAFLPFDTTRTGIAFNRLYPEVAPVYIITVTLTQKVISIGRYGLPLTVSTMTVQPYNESEIQVMPFIVSCQTHCGNETYTPVCQRQSVIVAGN